MLLKNPILVLLLLLLSCTFHVTAATLSTLAHHPTWLKLLHYEPDSSSKSGYKSAIHSPEFFLSTQGRTDPFAELQATLSALKAPMGDDPNHHAHCRFPARSLFLAKQQPNQNITSVSNHDCPDFYDWSNKDTTQSLSIVFASGFLGNPASFYGHTLLKLNQPQTPNSTPLEDTSINYGAIDIDKDNPVAYILKGIFGGYDSGFSDIKYYFHDHNYGENELRDMWEYELALTPQEVTFVVAHAWEVMGKKYTYYFFKQNCAYRMAELFSIIDGINLIPDNPLWVFPQAVIQKVENTRHHGQKLLASYKKHPSRQSKLYNKFAQLEQSQQRLVQKIAEDINILQQQTFNQLPLPSQLQIIDTLLDYYNIIRDKQALTDDPANLAYKKVLAKRFALPPGDIATPPPPPTTSPHKGRKPSYVSTGIVHTDNKDMMRLQLRPAYYDALDADEGHIDYAQLSMGELSIDIADSDFSLNYLDIIRINSINSQATGLPRDSGFAWNIKAGWQRLDIACSQCATFRFQGDIGYSYPVNHQLLLAAYVGGGIQDVQQQYSHAFTRASLQAIGTLSDKLTYSMAIEARHYIAAKTQYHHDLQLRYRIDTNLDARITYQYDGTSALGVSLGYYW